MHGKYEQDNSPKRQKSKTNMKYKYKNRIESADIYSISKIIKIFISKSVISPTGKRIFLKYT